MYKYLNICYFYQILYDSEPRFPDLITDLRGDFINRKHWSPRWNSNSLRKWEHLPHLFSTLLVLNYRAEKAFSSFDLPAPGNPWNLSSNITSSLRPSFLTILLPLARWGGAQQIFMWMWEWIKCCLNIYYRQVDPCSKENSSGIWCLDLRAGSPSLTNCVSCNT